MPVPPPFAAFFDELERLIERADRRDIPALLGDLERLRAMAWARLSTPQVATQAATRTRPGKDRLLSAGEAAKVLGVSARWVYDHADELGGQRLSPRCLRFPEKTIKRRMERGRS